MVNILNGKGDFIYVANYIDNIAINPPLPLPKLPLPFTRADCSGRISDVGLIAVLTANLDLATNHLNSIVVTMASCLFFSRRFEMIHWASVHQASLLCMGGTFLSPPPPSFPH